MPQMRIVTEIIVASNNQITRFVGKETFTASEIIIAITARPNSKPLMNPSNKEDNILYFSLFKKASILLPKDIDFFSTSTIFQTSKTILFYTEFNLFWVSGLKFYLSINQILGNKHQT